ncbi:MAG: hypothetical protein ACWGHO_00325 [Candidatus Moraniibacteriota bacterium]
MSIFGELLLFFLSLAFLLLVPGYFLILAIFRKKTFKLFAPIEIITIAFASSLIAFDFLIILFGKIGFKINTLLILSIISLFSLGCYLIFKFKKGSIGKTIAEKNTSLKFSHLQTTLIILILFSTIFIKTVYLKDAIFPTATDLGHHMYWSKLISETGELPDYRKNEITQIDNSYQLQSEPIADFIIGEHLIFSGVNILTKIPFNSYFPALILFAINIISLLAMFILSLRVFKNSLLKENLDGRIINPVNLSILVLFLIGPIYAIASPQSKFISGGVIGNLVGNLLIPICLYFFYRALKEKNSWMLFMGLFLSAGLFYTHHLSGFIFLFILAFIFIIFNLIFIAKILTNTTDKFNKALLSYKQLGLDLFKLITRPQILLFFVGSILFLFLVYTPSYLSPSATATAVGAPSKSTRAGLTLTQFKYAVGELRLTFGIIGILILAYLPFAKKTNTNISLSYQKILPAAILIGWASCLFFMTNHPNWLHINLPSDRVANYANFPFILLSSLGLLYFISLVKKIQDSFLISKKITYFIFILVFSTLVFSGYYDNSQALSDGQKNQKALQTFHLSEFLSKQIKSNNTPEDTYTLKDHNYISSDSWMKLFFMKDYNYPLSRGYFKRYEDPTKPREMCTLWMISEPASERAQECFSTTKTKYIIVDTSVDGPQFKTNPDFSKVYESDSLSIFSKR